MAEDVPSGLENKISKRKMSWIAGGLAALALAAGGIAAGRQFYHTHYESPDAIATQLQANAIYYGEETKERDIRPYIQRVLTFVEDKYGLKPSDLLTILAEDPRRIMFSRNFDVEFTLAYPSGYIGVTIQKDGSLDERYHLFPDKKQWEIIDAVKKHIREDPFVWPLDAMGNREEAYKRWLKKRKKNHAHKNDFLMVYGVKRLNEYEQEEKAVLDLNMTFGRWVEQKPSPDDTYIVEGYTPRFSRFFVTHNPNFAKVVYISTPM